MSAWTADRIWPNTSEMQAMKPTSEGDLRIFYGVLLNRKALRSEMIYCEHKAPISAGQIGIPGRLVIGLIPANGLDANNPAIVIENAPRETVEEIREWLAATDEPGVGR